MKNKNISLLIILLIISVTTSYGQTFRWKSDLAPVKKTSFYQILISPSIFAKLNDSESDLRIFDQSNTEIPYIFNQENHIDQYLLFREYKIIEKENNRKKDYTKLIIHNPKKTNITNFALIIKNADIRKHLTLSGSNDNKNWYIIKEKYFFEPLYSNNENSVIKILDFPMSNYEYYQVVIYDFFHNPINIIKAGYFDMQQEEGLYSSIDSLTFEQTEKDQQSLIKIQLTDNYQIDKLKIEVESDKFYYRKCRFFIIKEERHNRKTEKYEVDIKHTALNSYSENTSIIDLRNNELYIEIENHDNQPLKIKSIKAYQLNRYLSVELSDTSNYELRFGNDELHAPIYDLAYFQDSIATEKELIKPKVTQVYQKDTKSKAFIEMDKIYIWIAIILVSIVMIYMVTNMLREMKKKK